jgi:predicted enzyme related to lactoylglutathione lyase
VDFAGKFERFGFVLVARDSEGNRFTLETT